MKRINLNQIDQYTKFSKFTCEKHPDSDLYIYGYDGRKIGAPIYWDDLNIHLRGLIVDSDGLIRNRSFPKFFTFKSYITKSKICVSEKRTLELPSCPFKIFDKIDGSMAVLYWIGDTPYLASQRSFISKNAQKATEILHRKYSHTFKTLNKKYSYIFEAIYPNTRVMVNYDTDEDLILLGVLDNETGIDIPVKDSPFPVPQDFTSQFGSLSDLNALVELNLPNKEGFVIHYENGLRIKLKFPWFREAHDAANKILKYNTLVYNNKQRLNRLLNLKHEAISNITIWEALREGKSKESLLYRIPGEFYNYGFEFWFAETIDSIEKSFSNIKSVSPDLKDETAWLMAKPENLDEFIVSNRRGVPGFATPFWNLLDRVNNSFL